MTTPMSPVEYKLAQKTVAEARLKKLEPQVVRVVELMNEALRAGNLAIDLASGFGREVHEEAAARFRKLGWLTEIAGGSLRLRAPTTRKIETTRPRETSEPYYRDPPEETRDRGEYRGASGPLPPPELPHVVRVVAALVRVGR